MLIVIYAVGRVVLAENFLTEQNHWSDRNACLAEMSSTPTGMSLDERLAASSTSSDGGSITLPLPERPEQLSETQSSKIRSAMAHAIRSQEHGPFTGDRSSSTSCYLSSSRSSRSG